MRLIYKNKYGQLELEVMGEYRAVSTIHCRDIEDSYSFGLDDSEKIVLITGGVDIQLCFTIGNLNKVFLIHHRSASMAAVCRVISLQFNRDINETRELARPNPYRGLLNY